MILTSSAAEEDAAPNRWNFKKADRLSFHVQCSSALTEETVMSAEDPTGQFAEVLIQAAAIHKSRFSKKLPKVPWFSDRCKKAVKERKKAQRKNSVTDNYSSQCQRIKMLKGKRRLDFSSTNEEDYNLPFSMTELKQSLQRTNDSATGLDQVHYQLLTHLPNSTLSVLLKVYNHVWESGCSPPSWCKVVVIPIPKPSKDHSDPGNFKTMERMINACLMWSLESQGLLSEKQCSFRKKHSTLDHLVHFETFIRNAFIKKEHVLTIFFDLEKAYDTTWKHSILADLWDLGFRGHLPRFIQSFLSECSFKVRVGSTLLELHKREMGVLQGSILSPALFSIKINDIVKAVLKGTDCSLFMDDFALCVSGKMLNRVERAMQLVC